MSIIQPDKCVQTLAEYAMAPEKSRGRRHIERDAENEFRTSYQRDIGRITHSSAFRRLQYKTQVFVLQPDDFSRTRLTHTLAVSQIARAIARAIAANEDLTEAIALAHDIGHSPFGHPGEDVLNEIMSGYGGFEHNKQALRVVDQLEFRTVSYPGLNLTYEVREGLARHHTEYDVPKDMDEFAGCRQATIEAQIVNVADSIAYRSHDLEDGLTLGLINPRELASGEIALWDMCSSGYESDTAESLYIGAPRNLINIMIHDAIMESKKRISENGIASVEDVRNCGKNLIALSKEMAAQDKLLGKFLMEKLYSLPVVKKSRELASSILPNLFEHVINHSTPKTASDYEKHRIACDIVASLTDRAVVHWSDNKR